MLNYVDVPEQARVWIYQSNKAFSSEQIQHLEQLLQKFVGQWQSHGKTVKAWAEVRYQHFIILAVDENYEAPSGCSIDSSVALMRQIEAEFGVTLFDRMCFAYKDQAGQVQTADRADFAALYAQKAIDDQTIVFNNLVNTKKALEEEWELPLSKSWHARMVGV